jgi:ABC-type dipeptide/oligopeptide/nickel transport system permease subunit
MTTTAITPGAASDAQPVRYSSFWVGAWRRFRRNKLAVGGLIFVIVILFIAIAAPVLTPYPYDKIAPANALESPSLAHPLGTDTLGRDMLSRIMFGARPMLMVGIIVNIIALLIGVPLGIIAGYAGGPVDWFISRLIDMFSALPWYLIVLFLVMVLSPSIENMIIALSVTSWVGAARLVRGMSFSIREQDYIEATQALGIPILRVLGLHVLPQVAPLLLWSFAASIPGVVFAEAGLSFLGMGVRPPVPSWGQMLAESAGYWQYWPHIFLVPGIMITLTVLAFQGMADGLREAMDVNINV